MESLFLFLAEKRLSTQGNVFLLLTHHGSCISRQSFQLNHFDPVSSLREDSFDTGQFALLFPSTLLGHNGILQPRWRCSLGTEVGVWSYFGLQ